MVDDRETAAHHDSTGDDFGEQITQPLALALALDAQGRKPNGLFLRLAAALDLSENAALSVLEELLVAFDATPQSFTPVELWSMRTGLFEVIDQVLPVAQQQSAHARLQILLLESAPDDHLGG